MSAFGVHDRCDAKIRLPLLFLECPAIVVETRLISVWLFVIVSMQLFRPSLSASFAAGFSLEFPPALADSLPNRPATPLNDAQFGGYFFARIWR